MSLKQRVIWSVVLLAVAPAVHAAGGVAELSLDRHTVAALVASGLPEPLTLSPPGLGTLTLELDGPRRLDFVDSAIEIELELRAVELGQSISLVARYVPQVEPISGTVQLVPDSVVTDPPLPFDLDLAGWLGSVDLPRRFEWTLAPDAGGPIGVTCFLQGVTVEKERLRLELGVRPRRGD